MERIEKTVFISYRRTDFPWALAIYKHLTPGGFDVFFDYTGIASGDFERIILENIRARAHFLVIVTGNALERCTSPDDWLRREIEAAMDSRRNIVPLFIENANFANLSVTRHLTGRLSMLTRYNGIGVPAEYFDAAMDRLCSKFLNVPLQAVLHPTSTAAVEAVREQQVAVSRDSLTGLISRREFEQRVERAVRNARTHVSTYAILHVRVDQLERVRESWGVSNAEALLTQLAGILKSKMHVRDTIARLGDEFGFLLENCVVEEAAEAAESIRLMVSSAKFSGNLTSLTASVGVAGIGSYTDDAEAIINAAASASQAALDSGGNRVGDLSDVGDLSEKDVELMRRRREMQWAARINAALEEGRFELFRMQIRPLQRVEPGSHFELLLRLRDENGRIVAPDSFITAAERYGITPAIDRWVIENAFRWLVCEADEREKLALCSINLSGQSLGDDKFLPFVIDQFHKSGLDASKICFEITETAAVASFSQANRFIQALKELGCKFALDDFGRGLSSFGYLKHFPVDFLKIDGSFVREILRDPIDREMVRSINEIGHLTGKRTVAEFAENAEIIQMLTSLGVDYAQGYGVSRPEALGLRAGAQIDAE